MIDESGSSLLCDFGKSRQLLSASISEDLTSSIEGTSIFLPPECCSFDHDEYSMKKTDIWSLGMTIYCMTFNKLPFSILGTDLDIMERICNQPFSYEGRKISEDLK